MSDNLHAKFGPRPVVTPPTATFTVLALQAAVCIAFLTLLQPPFVMDVDGSRSTPHLSVLRVFAATSVAITMTLALHAQDAKPVDTFARACEFFVHAVKS